MSKHLHLSVSILAVATMTLSVAHAANLTKAAYSEGKTQIGADYKAGQAACSALKANAKDICIAQAKAKQKVARAELEFSYTGKAADGTKVRVAKAESAYAVAKEKCDDLAGDGKDLCVKEAKAVEVKALAEAKLGQQIGEARSAAAQDVRAADYDVAAQKCDKLAGDAKDSCLAAAKAAKAAPAVVEKKPMAKKEKKGGC